MPIYPRNQGYLYPDPVRDYPLTCFCVQIPDHQLYRAAFRAQVYELTRFQAWKKIDFDTRGEVVDYMREVLLPQIEADMSCCCDPQTNILIAIQRQTNIQIRQTIYGRYNGTDANSINPDAPNDNYDGDGSTDRLNALCMACKAFVSTLGQQWLDTARLLEAGTAVVAFAAFLFPAIGLLAIPGAVAGIALIEIGIRAWQDEAVVNDVICCMYTALKGQTITPAHFKTALDACGFAVGSDQAIVRDLVAAQLGAAQNWAVFVDALGAAYLAAQAGVVDCPCGVCIVRLAGNGNADITSEPVGADSGSAVYDSTNDQYIGHFYDGSIGGYPKPAVSGDLRLATDNTRTIISISVVIDVKRTLNTDTNGLVLRSDGTDLQFYSIPNGTDEQQTLDWTGTTTAAEIQILYGVFCHNPQDGRFNVKKITVCYSG